MIIILTIENDYSTSKVIDWLHYFNRDIKRINYGDNWGKITFSGFISNADGDFIFENAKVKSIWFRKLLKFYKINPALLQNKSVSDHLID